MRPESFFRVSLEEEHPVIINDSARIIGVVEAAMSEEKDFAWPLNIINRLGKIIFMEKAGQFGHQHLPVGRDLLINRNISLLTNRVCRERRRGMKIKCKELSRLPKK